MSKTLKSKLKYIKNGSNIMLPDSWKSAFEMASEDYQKNNAQKYEKHEIL